jgi:mannitol/fructose-specific phosphotransferase system IIA component (Ntr-type)
MLSQLIAPDAVSLDLAGSGKDAVLAELVALLGVDQRNAATLHRMLRRREALGSTGVGRGVAIPHARSLVVDRLRLAFGRHPGGIAFDAIDARPVHYLFLIVAPPVELSNQYLPVLGRIAQFVKEPDVPDRLARLASVEDLYRLLHEKGL